MKVNVPLFLFAVHCLAWIAKADPIFNNRQSSTPANMANGPSTTAVTAASQRNHANDPSLVCNHEMMTSYGLRGHAKPVTQPHRYCPGVVQNCCDADDEESTMYYWVTDSKNKIERYYEVYLYSLKYILGFSEEGFLLARDFEKSPKSDCKNAAAEYISMNLNTKLTLEMYNTYVTSLAEMGNVRRGFFCTLCDARTQSQLRDFWASTNLFYDDRIYFSKEFCRKLVDSTIRASYFTVNYLKRYSENLTTLMNCKSGNAQKVTYEIPFWTRQQVKNCFFFKNKYFFFFCENYCERFHFTKASDILDGDLENLKKFVEHIAKFRNEVFYNPTNNVLMDGMTFEESYIIEMYPEVLRDTVFFKAGTQQQVQLDKFKTDVVYFGGMDPFLAGESSKYELVLASASLVKTLLAGLALVFTAVVA
jgi:hypothetical protein